MDFQKVFFTTTKKSDKSGPWIGVVCADNLTNLGTATNTCYTLEGPRLFQDILNSLKLSYNSLRTMYYSNFHFGDSWIFSQRYISWSKIVTRHSASVFRSLKTSHWCPFWTMRMLGNLRIQVLCFGKNWSSFEHQKKPPAVCWFGWKIWMKHFLIDFFVAWLPQAARRFFESHTSAQQEWQKGLDL